MDVIQRLLLAPGPTFLTLSKCALECITLFGYGPDVRTSSMIRIPQIYSTNKRLLRVVVGNVTEVANEKMNIAQEARVFLNSLCHLPDIKHSPGNNIKTARWQSMAAPPISLYAFGLIAAALCWRCMCSQRTPHLATTTPAGDC
eukprot:6188419-Pleurochrysis_carterae.AAC.4